MLRLTLTRESQDFIAKYLGDISKAILTVGFASYFFEKLPIALRFGFIIIACGFFVLSVIIIENKGGRK